MENEQAVFQNAEIVAELCVQNHTGNSVINTNHH